MKTRAGEEVRVSLVNTIMLHDWEKVMKSPGMTAGLKKDTVGTAALQLRWSRDQSVM
jgi:hypothetical protein